MGLAHKHLQVFALLVFVLNCRKSKRIKVEEINEHAQLANADIVIVFLVLGVLDDRKEHVVNGFGLEFVFGAKCREEHPPKVLLAHKPLLVFNLIVHALPHLVKGPVVHVQLQHLSHDRDSVFVHGWIGPFVQHASDVPVHKLWPQFKWPLLPQEVNGLAGLEYTFPFFYNASGRVCLPRTPPVDAIVSRLPLRCVSRLM